MMYSVPGGMKKRTGVKLSTRKHLFESKRYYHQGKSKRELKTYKDPKKKEKKEPINLLKKLSSSPSSKSGTREGVKTYVTYMLKDGLADKMLDCRTESSWRKRRGFVFAKRDAR